MPEQRPIKLYEKGVFIGIEGYFEVSDEELAHEQLTEEYNSAHIQALNLINSWDSMTSSEKLIAMNNAFPKILKWMLWKDGWLKPGML